MNAYNEEDYNNWAGPVRDNITRILLGEGYTSTEIRQSIGCIPSVKRVGGCASMDLHGVRTRIVANRKKITKRATK